MMIRGYRHFITQLVGPYHFLVLIELLAHATIDVIAVRGTRVLPVIAFRVNIIIAQGRLELQILDELIFTVDGIERAGHIFARSLLRIKSRFQLPSSL